MRNRVVFFCAVLTISNFFVHASTDTLRVEASTQTLRTADELILQALQAARAADEILQALHAALSQRRADLIQWRVNVPTLLELRRFDGDDIEGLFKGLRNIEEAETGCQVLRNKTVEELGESDVEASVACLNFRQQIHQLAEFIIQARRKARRREDPSVIPLHRDPDMRNNLESLVQASRNWQTNLTARDYRAHVAPRITRVFERAGRGAGLSGSPPVHVGRREGARRPIVLPSAREGSRGLTPSLEAPPRYLDVNPRTREMSSSLSRRIPVVGDGSPFESIVLRYGMDAARNPIAGQSGWIAAIYAERRGCQAARTERRRCEGVFLGVVPFDNVIRGTSPYVRLARVDNREYEVYLRMDGSEDRSQGRAARQELRVRAATRQQEGRMWEEKRQKASQISLRSRNARELRRQLTRLDAFIEEELNRAPEDYQRSLDALKQAINAYKEASARDKPTYLAHIRFRFGRLEALIEDQVRSLSQPEPNAEGLDATSIGPRLDVSVVDAPRSRNASQFTRLIEETIERNNVTREQLSRLSQQMAALKSAYPELEETLSTAGDLLTEVTQARNEQSRREALRRARERFAEIKRHLDSQRREAIVGRASRTLQSMRQDLVESCRNRGMPIRVVDPGQNEQNPQDDRAYNLCAVNAPLLKLGYTGMSNPRPFDPNAQMLVILANEDEGRLVRGLSSLRGMNLRRDTVLYPQFVGGEAVINAENGMFLVKGPGDARPSLIEEVDMGLDLPSLRDRDKRGVVWIRLADSRREGNDYSGFRYSTGALRVVDRRPQETPREPSARVTGEHQRIPADIALESMVQRRSADLDQCPQRGGEIVSLSRISLCLKRVENNRYEEPEAEGGIKYGLLVQANPQTRELNIIDAYFYGSGSQQVRASASSASERVSNQASREEERPVARSRQRARGRSRTSAPRRATAAQAQEDRGAREEPADSGLDANVLARIETAVGESRRRFPLSECRASRVSVEIPGVGSRTLCVVQSGSGSLTEPEAKDGFRYTFTYREQGGRKILTGARR